MKKIFKKIANLFKNEHLCPKCNTEMICYGSHPWSEFTYECDNCKETKI